MHFTTLLFVRHGQARATDGSYDLQTPLNALGRWQAEQVAEALAARAPPTVVYASPLPRARDTAAPLCRLLNLQLIVDPRLVEFDLGSNPFEVVLQRPDLVVWRSEHRGLESGETLGAFSKRVAAFCDHVAAHHIGERVAIFTHSGVIDAALRWALGIPPDAPWLHEFNIGNGSITEIDFWPHGRVPNGAPRYAAINATGEVRHLGEHASDM